MIEKKKKENFASNIPDGIIGHLMQSCQGGLYRAPSALVNYLIRFLLLLSLSSQEECIWRGKQIARHDTNRTRIRCDYSQPPLSSRSARACFDFRLSGIK